MASDDAYSLPSHYYTDPAILELELERIFYRAWNLAGYTSQLRAPGDYITSRVGGESIIVIVDGGGRLRAFYNVCRHRAHQLLQGTGCVKAITCPYHAWTYETDGRLRFARNSENVSGFDAEEFSLSSVQVESFCGLLFVNLDADAQPLREQVPELAQELHGYEPRLGDLTLTYRLELSVATNWKNVIDNYNENYHTPKVHPILATFLDDSYRVTPQGMYIRHESGVNAGAEGGFDVQGTGYDKHLNWWLWPNLCLMSFPGGGLRVLHVAPDGPDQCRETYDFYLPYQTPTHSQWEQIHYACDTVNGEDVSACEGIQRGIGSRGFERSRIMLDPKGRSWSEIGVLHFKRLMLEALSGA